MKKETKCREYSALERQLEYAKSVQVVYETKHRLAEHLEDFFNISNRRALDIASDVWMGGAK